MINLTRKRIILKLAKDMRKNTRRDLVNCIELSKVFLRNKYEYSDTDNIEGFVYEFDNELSKRGYSYSDCMFRRDQIQLKDSEYKIWYIPNQYYELRDKYFGGM